MVEVARGADSTVGMTKPHIPLAVAEDLHPSECQSQLNALTDELLAGITQSIGQNDYAVAGSSGSHAHGSKSNEEVLVHQPPNGICADDDVLMVDEDGTVSMSSPKMNGNGMSSKALLGSTNTGLSQSDLSLSSSAGSNQGYNYGNQELYTVESKGYPSTSPRFNSIGGHGMNSHEEQFNSDIIEPQLTNGNDVVNSKPIITAAIYKSDSNSVEIGNCAEMEAEAEVNETKEILSGDLVTEPIPVPIEFETIENKKVAIQVETIPTNGILTPKTNGKFHPIEESDVNENEIQSMNDESNEFDSLMNLPAPPPTCDEFKHLNEFGTHDNGNLDSLPPPPPEVAAGGPSHCES